MSKRAVPTAYAKAKRSYRPAQTSEPGFTLHKLNPDDFHEICGLTESVKTIVPDSNHGPWNDSQFIAVGEEVFMPGGKHGTVSGFAVDVDTGETSPFARVNGRLYHVSALKRA